MKRKRCESPDGTGKSIKKRKLCDIYDFFKIIEESTNLSGIKFDILKNSRKSKGFERFKHSLLEKNRKFYYAMEFSAWKNCVFGCYLEVRRLLMGMNMKLLLEILEKSHKCDAPLPKDKQNIVDYIMDLCFQKGQTRFDKRMAETLSLEQLNPENESVVMLERNVPYEIVSLILSFVDEICTLCNFGCASKSCYIIFLCCPKSLELTKERLYRIPILALRNCSNVLLRTKGMVVADFEYVLGNILRCETLRVEASSRHSAMLFFRNVPPRTLVRSMEINGACLCHLKHLRFPMEALRFLSLSNWVQNEKKQDPVCNCQYSFASYGAKSTLARIKELRVDSTMLCFYNLQMESMEDLEFLLIRCTDMNCPNVKKMKSGIKLKIVGWAFLITPKRMRKIKEDAQKLGIDITDNLAME